MADLEASYRAAARVARERARNFYYSFLLLDRERRRSMCAVYAFMRECDDLTDGPGRQGREALEAWRADLDAALAGRYGANPVWPALHDTVRRYGIPPRCLHEMIDGVAGDLEPRRVATFDELYRYCYQVAGVVGLAVIHILGFEGEDAPLLAEKCGAAFQLTNILRDVREDAEAGRVYLPANDLERFGVTYEDLLASRHTPAFHELMRFETGRAWSYYREALPLLDRVRPEGRPMLWTIVEIYSRLLERIEEDGYDVLRRRVALPGWRKTAILVQGLLGRGRLPARARPGRPG
jgi:phytoene synthase